MDPQEVGEFFRGDENSSSPVHIQLPATTDTALTTPPPDRTFKASLTTPPHSASALGPDGDEGEEGMPDIYIPSLIVPTMFPQILDVRPLCFSEPSLTRWPSKYIKLPLFTFLDRSFICIIEQIYISRGETDERFGWRVPETGFSFQSRL